MEDETSFVLMKYAMRQCSLKNTLSEKGAFSLMSAGYDDSTGTVRGRIEPGSVSDVTLRSINMDKVLCPLYLCPNTYKRYSAGNQRNMLQSPGMRS